MLEAHSAKTAQMDTIKFGFLGIALLGTSLFGTAPALAGDPSAAPAACSALGLNPSEAPFIACVKTLTQSAQSKTDATMSAARATDPGAYAAPSGATVEAACSAVGLDPSTARYSYCVSNLRQVLLDQQNFLTR